VVGGIAGRAGWHLWETERGATSVQILEAKTMAVTVPPRTILVVDDEVLIAMLAGSMITDLGYTAIEANSAAQALEILRGSAVDLLISDYSMPRMSGAELARKARELRPGLPILLATGYSELPPGTDLDLPRIAKPYTQDQLGLQIRRLLPPEME
jgi:CheY-like chemotaxis protein